MLRDRVLESIQKQTSPLPPQTLRAAPRRFRFPSSRLSQRGTNTPSEKQSRDSPRPSVVHLSFASSFSPCHISQLPPPYLLTIIAIHTPTVPRASVASAAASQTFPSMAPTASLPARVRRRYDTTGGTLHPRRLRSAIPSRYVSGMYLPYILRMQIPEFWASRLHANFPPSYNTPKMNRRLHPAYPTQQPHSPGRRLEYHDRFPSLSPSLTLIHVARQARLWTIILHRRRQLPKIPRLTNPSKRQPLRFGFMVFGSMVSSFE